MCNAHLIRELTGLEEDYAQPWAGKMRSILLEALAERERSGVKFSLERLKHYQHRASIQLGYGRRDNPEQLSRSGAKNRKQSVAVNLLRRFEAYKTEIWRFAHDLAVPCTNNCAE